QLLRNSKLHVNHVNHLGWTALLEAIVLINGNPTQQAVIQLLIEHGADANIPDQNNLTPLQHGRQRGFNEIEQFLIAAGAK
uniref:ankyrin repeat domain-containing protein n=1 Tax=Lysinibacillus fusiformis TaxID=28031 RepID=UPI0030B9C557